MPEDGLAEETSKLDLSGENDNDNSQITNALSRLKAEVRKAMASGNRVSRDVTEDFKNAAEQLQPGELVKDDFFTLFESVGALEIMDPKMDSGFIPEGDTFDTEFEQSSGLNANEVIYIMDQLLCLEITWLDGYPLSQTIFTSLHIDRLLSPDKAHKTEFYVGNEPPPPSEDENTDILLHLVLRAYCIALIKSCELALNLIQSQHFYDEEDFVTHLYGHELLMGVGASDAKEMLIDALDWISNSILPNDVARALMARCNFRFGLLMTLAGDSGKRWDAMIYQIETIKESHDLGSPVETAFSEKVQRQLATSTPPRTMIKVSFDVACSKWTKLCEDMLAAYRLTSNEIIQSPHCLQRAVWAFAYRGQPSTLARAEMQEILFTDNAVASRMPHYDLMLLDLRDLVLAGDPLVDPESFQIEVPSDPRHICSIILQGFLEKAIEEYLNFYRMVCQNRCRMRRTFTQAISILDTLQQEADNADEELKEHLPSLRVQAKVSKYGPLLTWTKYHTLQILAWTVQLGFETEIYLPDELGKMYWLLARFCASRTDFLEGMQRVVKERKKSRQDASRNQACAASLKFLKSLSDSSQVTRLLAEALAKFYYLLGRLGIIKPPKRDFADPDRLYEVRMKPYLCASNGYVEEHIPAADGYEKEMEAREKKSIGGVAKEIEEDIKKAKTALEELKKYSPEQAKYVGTEEEWKKEIKQTETTCVAVVVSANQLVRIQDKYATDELGEAVECGFEKKYHEWWVLPQLKERIKK